MRREEKGLDPNTATMIRHLERELIEDSCGAALTVYGFFKVNRSTLVQALATALTYVIVLMQFKAAE